MATDPRRRSSASNGNENGGLLFAGEDAMDVDDDDEDLFDGDKMQDPASSGLDPTVASSAMVPAGHPGALQLLVAGPGGGPFRPVDLISTIITPSPFAHHTTGPTSSRYRNFLQRITANPRTDIEAWQALLAEVSTCWKSLQNQGPSSLFALDAETQLKLDWVESCYGALLKYFPYSFMHYLAIGEILWILSARVGEEGGPKIDYGGLLAGGQRSETAGHKLETILGDTLGFDLEGNPIQVENEEDKDDPEADGESVVEQVAVKALPPQRLRRQILSPTLGGMCTSSVELWLLYIKTRSRHAKRKYGLPPNFSSISSQLPSPQQLEAAKSVLEDTKKAYELAIDYAGFSCFDNHILWKEYLAYAKSMTPVIAANEQDRNASLLLMTPQQHMGWMRGIYQDLICHPMTGLDQLWKEYEDFERGLSDQLADKLIPEWLPKYQHARNVYLERFNRVFNPTELNWKETWSTPPVSSIRYDDEEDDGEEYYYDEGTIAITGADGADGEGLATPKRKKRRKKKVDGTGGVDTGAGDDGATGESWEDYQTKLKKEFDYLALWKKRVAFERTDPERLQNSQEIGHRVRSAYKEMICVLTLYPEAWHMWSMWEDTQAATISTIAAENGNATKMGNKAIAALQLGQTFLPDSTLLVQAQSQLVELHAALSDGKASSHAKPSDCLRVLERFLDRAPNSLGFCLYQRLVRRYKGAQAARKVFSRARRVLSSSHPMDSQADGGGESDGVGASGHGTSVGETSKAGSTIEKGSRWMVTNRLDPSIGKSTQQTLSVAQNGIVKDIPSNAVYIGPITWHLYASHATIEHRINKSPETAARIFELGLRKHASFLTKPAYILKYGQLLMELQDTVNLRALLTRALAACGDSRSSQVEALWDMTLQCEELWSISDPTNVENVIAVERKRRKALLGPEIEDVATGSRVDFDDNKIGSQKTSLTELLNSNDGYNASSMIVNGMSRSVDVLDIMGLWGDGAGMKHYLSAINKVGTEEEEETIPGGKSDKSYQRRLQFARKLASGASAFSGIPGVAESGTTATSVRQRFQQQGQNAPIQLAIQQSPDWLRPFLLLLPASRLRGVVAKAPPHMVEMALTSLRNSQLPAERPNDGSGKRGPLLGTKRSLDQAGGDDSDDEDTGPSGSGGYGTAFRARQRARMTNMNGDTA